MKTWKCCAGWILVGFVLLMSPVLLVFAVPFGYGIIGDLVATAWLAPLALTLAGAIAFNAARRGVLLPAGSAKIGSTDA
jgi:hypothetical protein